MIIIVYSLEKRKKWNFKKDGSVRWVLKHAGYSQNQMYWGKFIIMIDDEIAHYLDAIIYIWS